MAAPLFAYDGVLKHFFKPGPHQTRGLRNLLAGAERYGATGSPDVGVPSGQSLEEFARQGAAGGRARPRPSNTELVEAYSKGAGALHAELELEQSPTGQLVSAKLSVSSGNPLFDAYVLEQVPKALASLGPAPEHFAGKKERVRSLWSIDGHVSFTRTSRLSKLDALNASDAAYLSALAALGVMSGNFEETTGEVFVPDLRRPHFDIRTRLLRAY